MSYQTLYNYFPNKAVLVRELLAEPFERWTSKVDSIIKGYDGRLIDSTTSLCSLSADLLLGPQAELWAYINLDGLGHSSEPNHSGAVSTIAQEHFYALLYTALGMGHLRQDIDLHLMAHTLLSLSEYNLLMLHRSSIDRTQFLQTQREQFELVIRPYLL